MRRTPERRGRVLGSARGRHEHEPRFGVWVSRRPDLDISPVLRVRRPVVPRCVPRSRSVRGRPRCCGTYGGRLSRAASMSCSALMMMVPPLVLVMCTAPPFMGRGETDLPQVALFLSSGVDL